MEWDLKKVFKKKEKEKSTNEKLDDEIQVMLEGLKSVDGESAKYGLICDNTKKLAEIKSIYEQNGNKNNRSDGGSFKINPNTVITSLAYVGCTALVLLFEADGGVIATRALQFLPKPKLF